MVSFRSKRGRRGRRISYPITARKPPRTHAMVPRNITATELIFGDLDKDNTPNIDDVMPLNPNISRQVDELLLTAELSRIKEFAETYRGDTDAVAERLKGAGFPVAWRIKSLNSIVNKLRRKHIDKLTDIGGCMVLTETPEQAYQVGEYIKRNFKVLDLEDFYKSPNMGYKALHFIVQANGQLPIEIQVKTRADYALHTSWHTMYKKGEFRQPADIKATVTPRKTQRKSYLDREEWYRRRFLEPARKEAEEKKAAEEKAAHLKKLEEWEKHPQVRYVELGDEIKEANRSDSEIKRWLEYKRNYESGKWPGGLEAFKERLSGYKASLVLGRDFLEDTDVYLKRKGLTRFWNYNFNESIETKATTEPVRMSGGDLGRFLAYQSMASPRRFNKFPGVWGRKVKWFDIKKNEYITPTQAERIFNSGEPVGYIAHHFTYSAIYDPQGATPSA